MIEYFTRRNLLGQRRYYFRVRGRNYETLAPSEAYNSAQGRDRGVFALVTVLVELAGFDVAHGKPLLIHDLDTGATYWLPPPTPRS